MCHFDGTDIKGGLAAMVKSLKELKPSDSNANKYSVYIVGGFNDDRKSSLELTYKLFSKFYSLRIYLLIYVINNKMI